MKLRITALALILALMSVFVVAPKSAGAASANQAAGATATLPITGTGTNGTFTGNFTLQGFQVVNGALVAVGTLTGTLTNTLSGDVQQVNQQVMLPVMTQQSTGSCQILDLVIGPISLNLLGLQITTNTIHLNITAQSGPGNLLGNLLCAVAHLLDNPGNPLGGLANLLNRLLNLGALFQAV